MTTILIYHRNCADGLTASWVYLHYLGKTDDVKLVPADAGKVPLDLDWSNKNVILLDISFKKVDLLNIAEKAANILILDHHESARDDLSGEFPSNVELIFDMNRCGAQLAWDKWFPNKPYPWFINVVADRDLWKWEHEHSKALSKYLFEKEYFTEHSKLNELLSWTTIEINKARITGEIMIEIDDKNIINYTKSAILCTFKASKTHKVYLVNCPHQYASDVGNKLLQDPKCDFVALWRYDFTKDEWWISCRSSKNRSDINLSKICSEFGGGGHPQAAGFTSKVNLHIYFQII
jgi:uncharacterized protein